jgi:hypothetical protein
MAIKKAFKLFLKLNITCEFYRLNRAKYLGPYSTILKVYCLEDLHSKRRFEKSKKIFNPIIEISKISKARTDIHTFN